MIDNKPLFAAYLNMARNNFYITLSHIDEKLGYSGDMNEDGMKESPAIKLLIGNKTPDIVQKAIELFKNHLPFIKVLLQNDDPANYAKLLISFIEQLDELRNYHTHYKHLPFKTDARVIDRMQFLFDVARREIRKRFSLTEQDVKHLVRKTAKVIDGKKTVVEIENFAYAFVKSEQFTEMGLAFFTCLFLEPKYAYLFLNQLNGIKIKNHKQKDATLKAFCFYHIHIPQPKLISNDKESGFLLDVLEELKRCPIELYEHLSEADQLKFKSVAELEELDEQPDIILKRSNENRFPQLALKYLEFNEDEKNSPMLQFHVDLGKYYFKVYEKNVDGEIRLRRLGKNMKGFGTLSDFNLDKMTDEWKQLVKRTDELTENYDQPYIVQTNPHYHIVNNQIGLRLDDKAFYPSLSPQIKNNEPEYWLSLYDLPALFFYYLIRKNDKKSKLLTIRKIISNHKIAIHKLFTDIKTSVISSGFTLERLEEELKNRGLKKDQVPEPILEYLLSQEPAVSAQKKAENRLNRMIEETRYLLNKLDLDIERAKEKTGSKRFRPIQTGKIADFLARDMMLFQPAMDVKMGKATGTLFQVLQARLAFYGRDKYLLESLYKECNLIQSKNPHPFLDGLSITDNLLDYYKNYLIRRGAYLEKCLLKCMKGKVGSTDFHFLHLGEREKRESSEYYKKLAGKFLSMPMNLPRGLFMDEIIKYFKTADTPLKNIVEENSRLNTIFLIKKYMENVVNDNTQGFYEWKRSYTVFNRHYDKRTENSREPLAKKFYDTNQLAKEFKILKSSAEKLKKTDTDSFVQIQRNLNYYDVNEKKLRHIKACDSVLFLLVRDLFPSLEKEVLKGLSLDQLKLNEVAPNADNGILSKPVIIQLPVLNKIISQEGIKLKNYGDFRRFLKDRRLITLLPYYEQVVINRDELEKELEAYDRTRAKIHELVLKFEERVIKENSSDFDFSKIENDKNCFDFNQIVEKTNYSAETIDLLSNIRNKFSHNQYPDFELFNERIKLNAKPITIAAKFEEIANELFAIE